MRKGLYISLQLANMGQMIETGMSVMTPLEDIKLKKKKSLFY